MSHPQDVIATAIHCSIVHYDKQRASFSSRTSGYFYVHWLTFKCIRTDLFRELRDNWRITDEDYRNNFGGLDGRAALQSVCDMGMQTQTFHENEEAGRADSRLFWLDILRHVRFSIPGQICPKAP